MLNSSTGWYQNLLDEEAAPSWTSDEESASRRRKNRRFRYGSHWGPFGSLLRGQKKIARSTGKEYVFVLCCCAAMALILIGFSGVFFENDGDVAVMSPDIMGQKMEVEAGSAGTVLSLPIRRRAVPRRLLGAEQNHPTAVLPNENSGASSGSDESNREKNGDVENKEEANVENKDDGDVENEEEANVENKDDGDVENKDDGDVENKEEANVENKDNGDVANEDEVDGKVTDDKSGQDDKNAPSGDDSQKEEEKEEKSVLTVYNRKAAEYFVDVAVGSEGQQFKLLLDTGSSNFWLASAKCGDLCLGHPLYDHEASSTYKEDGRTFQINYGEGHVEGFFSKDTVTVGDFQVADVTVGEMTISTDSGTPFNETVWDGVVGLAFPSISVSQQPPLFTTLLEKKLLKEPLFAMKLPRQSDVNGELTIGGYNSENFEGEIQWFNVTHPERPAFWTISLEKVEVTYRTEIITVVAEFDTNSSTVVIDSGTSYLTGPSVDVARLAQSVGAEEVDENQPLSDGVYFLPCNKTSELPNIEFTLGESVFQLTPDDYVVPQEKDPQNPTCVFAFLPLDIPKANPDWILGDIFMHKYYTIFDYGTEDRGPRVGLAVAV